MNLLKYVIIFSLFIFQTAPSQTFVDDVERVAIVVIDYCVDENGKQYNIKINQEKSTYKHDGWQQGCLEHFNNGVLRDPMNMVNKCWQSVYYFVNSKYKTYELPKAEREKCKDLHRGTFKYESPAYSETKIKRRKRKQIEKGGYGGKQIYNIEWLDDHIYTLETVKMSLAKDKIKEGDIITVEIIELLDEDTYLYKAYSKDEEIDTNVVYGLISRV